MSNHPISTPESDLRNVFDQVMNYVDSNIALIGATMLDEALEECLLEVMQPLTNTMKARLFKGYGPLSTLSAKIDMSLALGVCDNATYNRMRDVNKTRVAFAHTSQTKDFTTAEISAILARFSGYVPDMQNRRKYFLSILQKINQDMLDLKARRKT